MWSGRDHATKRALNAARIQLSVYAWQQHTLSASQSFQSFTMSEQSSSESSAGDRQVAIPLNRLRELMAETARSSVQAKLSQHLIAPASSAFIFFGSCSR